MNSLTKTWLSHSIVGFLASISLIALFDAFPSIRIFSNEAVIFGVMCAFMRLALTQSDSHSKQINYHDDESSNANQQS
jgi:hypothetical protein